MLTQYPCWNASSEKFSSLWIDLCDPNEAEIQKAEALTGMKLPTRDTLSEIESSSRLRERDGVLSVSMPMFTHRDNEPVQSAPIGFLLSRDHLVTLRFARLEAFAAITQNLADASLPLPAPWLIFVDLCDAIVDRLADSLEKAAADLRNLSTDTFHVPEHQGRQAIRSNHEIRAKLQHVGRLADGISETRDVLLGIGRVVDFIAERTRDWHEHGLEVRLSSIQRDVASLDEYEVHLSDKIQFLLDAMVGLIGIAQNDVFKILTIVSIVGIPPTLLAGIYGMNFKYMPEYNWTWGYPYGLAVIALSAILPLAWFKWRGWF